MIDLTFPTSIVRAAARHGIRRARRAGVATGRGWLGGERETVTAGSAGLRYLIAKSYGMHMGIDVARGPDQTIWYVVFGNGWFRP